MISHSDPEVQPVLHQTYSHPPFTTNGHAKPTQAPPDALTVAIDAIRRDVRALRAPEIQTVLREKGDTLMEQTVIEACISKGPKAPRINFPKMWAALATVEDEAPRLSMVDIEKLAVDVPHVRLIEGALPRGGTGLLAGLKGAGKSSLGRSFGVAVSRGGTFLRRKVLQKGPVVIYSTEELEGEVARDLLALDLKHDDQVYVRYGQMLLPTFLKRLQEDIDDLRPALVFVDTLMDVLQLPDINDYMAVGAAMLRIRSVTRHTDTFLLANHHLGKATGTGRPTVEKVLGSTALIGKVDGIILLHRMAQEKREVMIWKRYRSDVGLDWTPLVYDSHTGDVTLGDSAVAEEPTVQEPTVKQLVLAKMKEIGKANSKRDLAGRINKNEKEVYAAINECLAEDLLHEDAPPEKGLYDGPWKPTPARKKR